MAQLINDQFFLAANEPLDSRQLVTTGSARDAIPWYYRYPGMQVYVSSVKKWFFLDVAIGEDLADNAAWTLLNASNTAAGSFLSLNDTPSSFGSAGQLVTVNAEGDGLIFADPADLPEGVIFADGSVAFTAPQEGVPAVEPEQLITLSQIQSSQSPGEYENLPATIQTDSYQAIDTDGQGVWIAVGFGNNQSGARTLDNGQTWLTVSLNTSYYKDIKSNRNGVWIAVQSVTSGRLHRSTDNGQTWTSINPTTSGVSREWQAIATNREGIWIAVALNAASDTIARSTDDGVTWSSMNAPEQSQWIDIAYGSDGVWIALGQSTSSPILRSDDDGLTWTALSVLSSSYWASIHTDGNGVWIAVKSGTNGIARSTDNGITWSTSTITTSATVLWNCVRSNKYGYWILVGRGLDPTDDVIARSYDNGATWVVIPDPSQRFWTSVATDENGTWFLQAQYSNVSNTTSVVKIVDDFNFGVIRENDPISKLLNDVGYISEIPSDVVRAGGTVPFTNPQEGVDAVDPEHLTPLQQVLNLVLDPPCLFTLIQAPEENPWNSVATDGQGVWLAVASFGTNRLMRSTDNGLTWTSLSLPQNNPFTAVETDKNGVWITVSNGNGDTNSIFRSTDNGSTWATVTEPSGVAKNYVDIATDGIGTWVIVGENFSSTVVARSVDAGLTFTDIPEIDLGGIIVGSNGLTSVLYATGDTFYAADEDSNGIYRSVDGGATWAELGNWGSYPFKALAYIENSGTVIAAGGGYPITSFVLRSADGVNFTEVSNGDFGSVIDLVSEPSGVVYALLNGTGDILYKSEDDGLTWSGTGQNVDVYYWKSLEIGLGDVLVAVGWQGTDRIIRRECPEFIQEAPDDGQTWGRSNKSWVVISSSPSAAISINRATLTVNTSTDNAGTWTTVFNQTKGDLTSLASAAGGGWATVLVNGVSIPINLGALASGDALEIQTTYEITGTAVLYLMYTAENI